jgi:hypothetical protein
VLVPGSAGTTIVAVVPDSSSGLQHFPGVVMEDPVRVTGSPPRTGTRAVAQVGWRVRLGARQVGEVWGGSGVCTRRWDQVSHSITAGFPDSSDFAAATMSSVGRHLCVETRSSGYLGLLCKSE